MNEFFFTEVMPVTGSVFFYLCLLSFGKMLLAKRPEPARPASTIATYSYKHDLATAALLYLICTALFFYPCLRNFSGALIGPPEDNMSHLWGIWWVQKALTSPDADLSFSRYIFYPQGTSLLYHAFSFYNNLLALPLSAVFSPSTVYNLLILHTFVFAGIGAFLLIKYLTGNSYAAFVGGFIFAFSPYHFARALHHIGLNAIQFIPFFVLYFIKAVRGSAKKDTVLAALFFLLTSICSWYYLALTACFIGCGYVYVALKRKRCMLKPYLLKTLVITGIPGLIMSPWLLQMIIIGMDAPGVMQGGHNTFVIDAIALVVPDFHHLLANVALVKDINPTYSGFTWESIGYLGIINMIIVGAAGRKRIGRLAKYFLGLLVFLLLAMGENLHILGTTIPLLLPFKLVKHLPVLGDLRAPSRAIVYVYLFWAIIVAFSLKFLVESRKPTKRFMLVLAALTVLVFFDYYSVDDAMTRVVLPACYTVMADDGSSYGILDLPPRHDKNGRYMMYQTMHGRPIVQGYISRKPAPTLGDYLEYDNLAVQQQQLIESHVKYIVIHQALLRRHAALNHSEFVRWNNLVGQRLDDYARHYSLLYSDSANLVFQVY